MGFLNFLGNSSNPLAGASPGFAGGMFGGQPAIEGTGGLEQALAQNAALGQQAAPQRPKLGIGDIIGLIGDAARGWKGQEPIYGPRMMEMRKQQTRNQALSNYLVDPEAAIRALFAAGDPETALAVMKARGEGGEGFTLGEGQARYDSKGRLVAAGPNKLDTVEIDGVVFDKRTGRPLFESPYDKIVPGAEGSFFRQRRQGFGRQGPAPGQSDEATLRAQAEEAIQMGADPEAVNKKLQEMLGGATASPSPIFP